MAVLGSGGEEGGAGNELFNCSRHLSTARHATDETIRFAT
jgi:hypothetical protein